jgi:hypothetical protein
VLATRDAKYKNYFESISVFRLQVLDCDSVVLFLMASACMLLRMSMRVSESVFERVRGDARGVWSCVESVNVPTPTSFVHVFGRCA